MSQAGTTGTGTTPMLTPNARHRACPAALPSGIPTTIATIATVGGLPEHDRRDLAPDHAEGHEQPAFGAPPRHAYHQQVGERSLAAQGHYATEQQREVSRPTEIHQGRGHGAAGGIVAVPADVAGQRGAAHRAGDSAHEDCVGGTGLGGAAASCLSG